MLDNPVRHSLAGTHRQWAAVAGHTARYPAGVAPFMALPDAAEPADWDQLIELAGEDDVVLVNPPDTVPPTVTATRRLLALQMVADSTLLPSVDAPDGFAVRKLDEADSAQMLDLAQRTKPGPFGPDTWRLGAYYGIERGNKLVAMAGERMRPPGWSEISGVCSDTEYRGFGLARTVVTSVVGEVVGRGDQPFLHVMEDNVGAIRLYRALGFTVRRRIVIGSYRKR
ncbi:FR47-like protein [Kribbella pratensis]|uniref:FR47-like protein n=2 Tax=Kribbella pratensis TaxID=2512112 RepID=A0A4R8C1Y1_9ACTN|nr:FR47-like protein [Kribbella pratensis]